MSILKGKTAFVTGGTRGMGEAIVRRYIQEGAEVAFTYVNSDEKAEALVAEIARSGGVAYAIKADASISGNTEKAIIEAADKFGKIDILVNNAAISIAGPVEQAHTQADDYNRQIDVNIRAVTEAVRTALRFMPDGGRIITIGSVGAKRIGGPTMSEYIATKAAVGAYSRGLAWDLGLRNITINTIEPGVIDTDMLKKADNATREFYMNAMALKRLGTPEDVAGLANFLAGPDATYITGSSIVIDGGFSA